MNLGIKTTTFGTPKNIWASTQGRRFTTLTIDATKVSSDANGNKVVKAGTAFAKLTNGKFAPYNAAEYDAGTQTAPVYYIDDDFDCAIGDRVVRGVYSGALQVSRLVTAPDQNIKDAMRTMDFR